MAVEAFSGSRSATAIEPPGWTGERRSRAEHGRDMRRQDGPSTHTKGGPGHPLRSDRSGLRGDGRRGAPAMLHCLELSSSRWRWSLRERWSRFAGPGLLLGNDPDDLQRRQARRPRVGRSRHDLFHAHHLRVENLEGALQPSRARVVGAEELDRPSEDRVPGNGFDEQGIRPAGPAVGVLEP